MRSIAMIMASLFILGMIGFIGACFPPSIVSGTYLDYSDNGNYYYDSSGHAVLYRNLTACGENGVLARLSLSIYAGYANSSSGGFGGNYNQVYPIYYDSSASNPVKFDKALTDAGSYKDGSFSISYPVVGVSGDSISWSVGVQH